ncbi:hypothetical protein ACFY84_29420 [Streptomyces sp. NPDC012438]|uniref:hypothetical protein n=1 Tax=Streptomyces sp. NPDC012438 TaxID=3364833 RepID=UPI0036F17906
MVNIVEQSIAQAMDDPDDRMMFTRVKDIVARHLTRMDPRAKVTQTEFFNHTHVPDMVLDWPGRPRTARRFIYLRTTADQRELEDDLHRLPSTDRPVLLTLGRLPFTPRRGELPSLPDSNTTLLLDTSALGTLQPPDSSPGIPHLVSRSVLEGGRGALDGAATEELLNTLVRGAEAARAGERLPTRDAVDALTAQMTSDVADQMSAFLAALWQGGGSTLSTFPSSRRTVGSLDESALTYLLESEEITDDAFWNRVVRMISLPVLLRTPTTDTGNLQHLMRQAIQLWSSRVCMIVPGLGDATTTPWRWAVKAGQLILQTPRFQIQVAQSRRQLPQPEDGPLPRLDEVRSRADRFGIPLTALRMVVTDRHIGYGGPGDDISHDARLDNISNALEQTEGVIEADARIASGAILQCLFGPRVASARGARTQIPLDALLGTTTRLLSDLTDDEAEKLTQLLGAQQPLPDQPWSQPSFDDL